MIPVAEGLRWVVSKSRTALLSPEADNPGPKQIDLGALALRKCSGGYRPARNK